MLLNDKSELLKSLSILFLLIVLITSFNSVYANSDNFDSAKSSDLIFSDSNNVYIENIDCSDSILINDYSNKKDSNLGSYFVGSSSDSYLKDSNSDSAFVVSNSEDSYLEDSNLNHSKNYLSSQSLSASSKSKVILTTSNLSASYKTKNFTAKLTDLNKNPIAGAKLSFVILSKTYYRTTDKDGLASLMINLAPGKYNISTKFEGDSNYSSAVVKNSITISKKKLSISSSDLSKKYGDSNSFQVKITDNGNPISDIKVALKLSAKTYYRTSDKNGLVSLPINLIIGKYIINSSVYDNKFYYSNTNSNNIIVSSQNPYNLSVLKWGTKGNIKKNSVLMNNIPKSSLTNAIISACNNGTPLIQFGNGSGKKVFINAGVHGHELSSQAAAFKLINNIYNSKKKINGTVYIVPVLCPKMTEQNARYFNNVNLNSVANKNGTVSNKLVNLALSLKVDVLGDFHCTRPNGDPGKNVAMGTSSPMASSATLAKYISKTTGYSSLIYKKAGEEYPGAVEDVCNLKGITSVTCEALTPHGKIASGSVGKSYNMMIALLKYYGITI